MNKKKVHEITSCTSTGISTGSTPFSTFLSFPPPSVA